jgi:predicted GTPase
MIAGFRRARLACPVSVLDVLMIDHINNSMRNTPQAAAMMKKQVGKMMITLQTIRPVIRETNHQICVDIGSTLSHGSGLQRH